MAGLLGHETYEVAVTIEETNIAFSRNGITTKVAEDTVDPTGNRAQPVAQFVYKDGIQVPLTIDTTNPENTISTPVKDYDLNTVVGEKEDVAQEDPTVDASIIAYMKGILTRVALKEVDQILSTSKIPTAGVTVGTTLGTVRKINVHSQLGEPLQISVGGTNVCIILAGGGGDFDCSGLTGDVVVKSLTNETTAGLIAINLMG